MIGRFFCNLNARPASEYGGSLHIDSLMTLITKQARFAFGSSVLLWLRVLPFPDHPITELPNKGWGEPKTRIVRGCKTVSASKAQDKAHKALLAQRTLAKGLA